MYRKSAAMMATAAFVTVVVNLYSASFPSLPLVLNRSIPMSDVVYQQAIDLPGYGIVNDLAWSPDGRTLALASSAGLVAVSAGDDPIRQPVLTHPTAVLWSLTYSPDGRWLAGGDFHGRIHIWDAATGELAALLDGHKGYIRALAFSPDSRLLASGGLDQFVRLWDVEAGNLAGRLTGHDQAITEIVFSDDGSIVTSGGGDGEVRLWDVDKRALLATLQGQPMTLHRMAFSRSGKIVSAGSEGSIRLWDWKPVGGIYEFTLRQGGQPVWEVAFDAHDRMLASAGADQRIRLWDAQTGAEQVVLDGPRNTIRRMMFSPDGHLLAALSNDNRVLLWRLLRD
ncbi:MAG: WD40 repeat domain-containing protein [Anaerolineae bacterium]|nr:WD40 repeat domain-containing protein [Anaerolineae bacterium]